MKIEIDLTEHEADIVRAAAAMKDLSMSRVIVLWMRLGQSVEVRSEGRRIFVGDVEELFPHGPGCGGGE